MLTVDAPVPPGRLHVPPLAQAQLGRGFGCSFGHRGEDPGSEEQDARGERRAPARATDQIGLHCTLGTVDSPSLAPESVCDADGAGSRSSISLR